MYECGYFTPYGYMGLVNGEFLLFATEDEYEEYLKEAKLVDVSA